MKWMQVEAGRLLQDRFSKNNFLDLFFCIQILALDRRDLSPGTLHFKSVEKFPFLKDFKRICIQSVFIVKAMNKMQGTFAMLYSMRTSYSLLQQTKPKIILRLLTKIEPQIRLNLLEDTESASESILQVIGLATSLWKVSCNVSSGGAKCTKLKKKLSVAVNHNFVHEVNCVSAINM